MRLGISCESSARQRGGAKVSCILRHRGVQLILAYSWARPAIFVAGIGGMFLFLLLLHFHILFLFLPCYSLSSRLLSLLTLFSQRPTRVDVSLSPNTIKSARQTIQMKCKTLFSLKNKFFKVLSAVVVVSAFKGEPIPTIALQFDQVHQFTTMSKIFWMGTKQCKPWSDSILIRGHSGVVGCGEGVVCLTSLGRPTDTGLQLGKACCPCSR